MQEHEAGGHREGVLYNCKSPVGLGPKRSSHHMARGTPLVSAIASYFGRDTVTFHRRGPKSRQPARDSQIEHGRPTHVPPLQGVSKLWSKPRLPEDTGWWAQGGGGGSIQLPAPPTKPLTLRAGGGGGSRSVDTSKQGEHHAPHRLGKSTWYGGPRSKEA